MGRKLGGFSCRIDGLHPAFNWLKNEAKNLPYLHSLVIVEEAVKRPAVVRDMLLWSPP